MRSRAIAQNNPQLNDKPYRWRHSLWKTPSFLWKTWGSSVENLWKTFPQDKNFPFAK